YTMSSRGQRPRITERPLTHPAAWRAVPITWGFHVLWRTALQAGGGVFGPVRAHLHFVSVYPVTDGSAFQAPEWYHIPQVSRGHVAWRAIP
ncbi:MAG: hypothetical protein ACI4B5_01765, partial [Bacteroidaceae bacterium]